MTEQELDRLASLISEALLRDRDARGRTGTSEPRLATWLPSPVRPVPPARGAEPPVWSGAAQALGDVAPGAHAKPSHRVSTAELTNVTRAAAAGRASAPETTGTLGRAPFAGRSRAGGAPPIDVHVGVSNRHAHLSSEHVRALFGADLTSLRALSQPGEFAANEILAVFGPKGRIDSVRVVGPTRAETQLELAPSDAARLGVAPPLAASGSLRDSGGGVTLIGPAGRVELSRGVIVAARHLHLAPQDAARWGLRDGDRLDVRCGSGARSVTFHDVLVRVGPRFATELHLDVDEARAAGVATGATATIVAWRSSAQARRPLVTERDLLALAKRGESLPARAILTPSARDRARALGLLTD